MHLPPEAARKYQLLRKLGEGGMGAVFQVRHRLLGHDRVIKVVRSSLAEDPEQRARFQREAQAAMQLRHERVAEVYDYTVEADGTAYIVMEYIEGLTLAELLRRSGRLESAAALALADQALAALGALHDEGFVHRDVAPDNLMLCIDGDGALGVKLIDLGLAKKHSNATELTSTGMFLGKVRYASPEQFGQGGSDPDGRSDLYSFGLVLYEMLTGQRAIQGDSVNEMVAEHLLHPMRPFEETDPEGHVADALRSVVALALEKKPHQRLQSAEAFRRALNGCFEHEGEAGEERNEFAALAGQVAELIEEQRRLRPAVVDEAAISDAQATLSQSGVEGIPATEAPTRSAGGIRAPTVSEGRVPRATRNLAAGALLVLLALLGWWWTSNRAAAQLAVLQLDATPWATIRVLDDQGREVPLDDDQANAPSRVELAVGSYRVEFQSPDGEVQWREVELGADGAVRRVDFGMQTPTGYFDALGLTSDLLADESR